MSTTLQPFPGNLLFISQPDNWPLWPVLPLKHSTIRHPASDNMPLVGWMYDWRDNNEPFTVYIGTLGITDPMKVERRTYNSLKAIVDAGWQAD